MLTLQEETIINALGERFKQINITSGRTRLSFQALLDRQNERVRRDTYLRGLYDDPNSVIIRMEELYTFPLRHYLNLLELDRLRSLAQDTQGRYAFYLPDESSLQSFENGINAIVDRLNSEIKQLESEMKKSTQNDDKKEIRAMITPKRNFKNSLLSRLRYLQ